MDVWETIQPEAPPTALAHQSSNIQSSPLAWPGGRMSCSHSSHALITVKPSCSARDNKKTILALSVFRGVTADLPVLQITLFTLFTSVYIR